MMKTLTSQALFTVHALSFGPNPLPWWVLLLFMGLAAPAQAQTPSVNMPFPQFNSSYLSGTEINVQATATTPAGTTVTKVEFYVDVAFSGTYTKIGEDETAPFFVTWTAPAVTTGRSYQLRAIVTNSASNTAIQSGTGYASITVYPTNYVSTRNWYVSASAPATNTAGTEALPFNTIQKAADRVAPGDTVFVMTGRYTSTGLAVVGIQRTGTPARPIVFMPYKADKPVVALGNSNFEGFRVLPAAAYIRIQGFEVIGNNASITLEQARQQPGACEGPNPAASGTARFNGNGISLIGSRGGNLRPHHVIITGNTVHDCAGGGIGGGECDYVTIENNVVYNTSWYTIYGTSGINIINAWNYDDNTTTPRIIIRNNRSFGNMLKIAWNIGGTGTNCKFYDGNGIILDNNKAVDPNRPTVVKNSLGDYTGKFLIENNLCYQNGGRGINVNYSDNALIINNTTYQNGASDGGPGIGIESEFIAQGAANIEVYNNIFYGRPGERVTEVNSSTIAHNNNLTFEGTGLSYFSGGQNKTGVDPLFVDATNGDFRLSANSPAVNAGSDVSGQYGAQDILGIARPQGAGVDMGAFELQGEPIQITEQPASRSAVCAGAAVQASVTVSGAVQGYQWYKADSSGVPVALTGVASATTAVLSLSNVTTADVGTYWVIITGFNSLTSTAFVLTVNPRPAAGLTSNGPISCTNPVVTLTAAADAGATYAFSSGASPVGGTNTATVTQAGTYSVILTSTEGCTASASVEVSGGLTVPDAPNASSLTVTQGTPYANLGVSNCAGTVSWNGTDGRTSLPVSTTAAGAFVYVITCTVGVCVSPVTSVTVTVKLPPVSLTIFHRDADSNPTNNQIRPYLKLYNESSTPIPYSEIAVRYWLTAENFASLTNLSVYYAQLGTTKVKMTYVPLDQPRRGALGYVEYAFDPSAGSLAANGNSGEIQTGIAKQNWTNLTETDDYSFAPNAAYTKTDRITVYRNGALVWGVEPALVTPVTALKVYSENKNSSPATNQIRTHLKLTNEGNRPVDYGDVTVRYWFSAEGDQPLVYNLDYAELGNANVRGTFVRVNRAGTDTFVELSFSAALGALQPLSSTGLIQQRINKADWSVFNEANDHSYKGASSLAENPNITAYINGVLVYGQEPAASGARAGAPDEPSALRVVVLGNPVSGDAVTVEVSGAQGQLLRFLLTDVQGRIVAEHQTEHVKSVEQYQLPIGSKRSGLFLLHVNTGRDGQTVKLLKQ